MAYQEREELEWKQSRHQCLIKQSSNIEKMKEDFEKLKNYHELLLKTAGETVAHEVTKCTCKAFDVDDFKKENDNKSLFFSVGSLIGKS